MLRLCCGWQLRALAGLLRRGYVTHGGRQGGGPAHQHRPRRAPHRHRPGDRGAGPPAARRGRGVGLLLAAEGAAHARQLRGRLADGLLHGLLVCVCLLVVVCVNKIPNQRHSLSMLSINAVAC